MAMNVYILMQTEKNSRRDFIISVWDTYEGAKKSLDWHRQYNNGGTLEYYILTKFLNSDNF
jgi:hypothetical protein